MLTALIFRGYIPHAAAKSAAGIGVPDIQQRITALAVFLCVKHKLIQIMVGCVGASLEAPDVGPVTPTLHSSPPMIGVVGGDKKTIQQEGVAMTTQISVESISLTVHQNIPVITTELLAQLYGTEKNNIKVNFTRNADRFLEGKHFFRVTGDELKNLRVTLSNSQNPISTKVRSLILWTERGAARHAKMLETDQAWDVFEKLEDCYFSLRPQLPVRDTSLISTRKEQRFILTLSDAGAKIQPVDENTFIGRVDQILSELRKSGWIVIKRDLLAEVLGTM